MLAAGLILLTVAGWRLFDAQIADAVCVTPERINPNTAPQAGLVRLPGIGKVRAMDIIAWRDRQTPPAFTSAESLEAIRGIGPKTSAALAEWLTFEEPQDQGSVQR
jgi:DNA uptake protein ComE-like DNA-binding protein